MIHLRPNTMMIANAYSRFGKGQELKPEKLEESYSRPDAERFALAWSLSERGSKRQAVELGQQLVRDGYQPAHLLMGLIYEFGGDGIEADLSRAIEHYRMMAYAIPSPIGYIHLARALMKQGKESYPAALRYLQEADREGSTPELNLAYATYYETAPAPNYEAARQHYLKAALRGRFLGFFGYAAMSRRLGQRFRAFLVDCTRIALGPFLFLLLGKTARKGF